MTINKPGPSKRVILWVAVAAASLCMGLCGVFVFFAFRANLVSRLQGPLLPTGDINTLLPQAITLTKQGKCKEALPYWDEILRQQPKSDLYHYQRAACYYGLLGEERNKQEHDLYIRKALADIDQAIALNPNSGDYHASRHDILIAMLATEEYRVNRLAIMRIAHEDAKAALALGLSNAYRYADRGYIMDLTTLEQCEESLAETERLLQSTAADDSSITGLYRMQADANACLGNFEEAVRNIDASLRNPNNFHAKTYNKALYLYQLGKLEEALSGINGSLDKQPTFLGYRYYLRALIYYDMGKYDLAKKDLETGAANTWQRMGLRSYVLGKMALDAGEREQGIELLQQAEATLDSSYMLIRTRIKDELAKLGAKPLSLTPSITIVSTPIPINPP